MSVLLILLDDAGGNLFAITPTPNLDRLAAISRRYTNAWTAPVCSADRAKLMTGRYPFRPENLTFGNYGKDTTTSLPTADAATTFLPAGAASSACYGKHHLCAHDNWAHPWLCGWGEYAGTLANIRNNGAGATYFNWPCTISPTEQTWESTYATTWVTDRGLEAISQRVELVCLSYNAPHVPRHIPPPWLHSQGNPQSDVGKTIAMLEAADTELARVLGPAIDAGYHVIVSSDNGSTNGLLSEDDKGTLYEGGLTNWLTIYGHDVTPGDDDSVVDRTDVHATVLELTGGPVNPCDGESLVSGFASPYHTRPYAFADRGQAVGQLPPNGWSRAVRDKRWKLIANKDGTEELYDLLSDPSEDFNEAGNPEHADKLEELRCALEDVLA